MNNKLENTEAYILGQAKFGRILVTPILAATNKQIAFAAQGRSRITISHDGAAPVYVGVDPMTATGQGMVIPPNCPPVPFCISDVGGIVNESWFAFSTAGCNVSILTTEWSEPQ